MLAPADNAPSVERQLFNEEIEHYHHLNSRKYFFSQRVVNQWNRR